MTTDWAALVAVIVLWLSAVAFAAWCLRRLGKKPPRPISEHCDEHWYRPHTGRRP